MVIGIFTEEIKFDGGGSQIAVLNFAKGFLNAGHKPVVFTIYNQYSKKTLSKMGIEAVFLTPFLTNSITLDFFSAFKYIYNNKLDLIILNETFTTYWIGLAGSIGYRIPFFAFFHTYYFKNRETFSKTYNYFYKKITMAYLLLCYSIVKTIAVPSDSAKIFLKKILSARIFVSPYPIFDSKHLYVKPKKNRGRKINFIYAGRIVKGKNVDVLVETMSLLKFNWKLTIVGDGSFANKIKEYVINFNLSSKVRFIDFIGRDGLFTEYAKHDVFVSFSDMETFGLTYLEALSKGLRLICLKYDTTDEIFKLNNSYVYKLKSKKPSDLADQLNNLFDQNYFNKKITLHKNLFKKYTVDNASSKLILEYLKHDS